MAIHLKTQWHKSEKKSIEDVASALAFNIWRLSVHTVDHIGDEEFQFETAQIRFSVLEEVLIFSVQVVERLAYGQMEDELRRRLITAMVLHLANTIDENQKDWIGQGEYRSSFIEKYNERSADYATFSFLENQPGYSFRRYLGDRVLSEMGNKNRWVIDQVIEIEIPELLKGIIKSFEGLFEANPAK